MLPLRTSAPAAPNRLESPLLAAALCALLPALAAGCHPYDTSVTLCKDAVPERGCPTGRGGTCDDPTCQALYDCVEGTWKKTSTCDNPTTGGAGGTTSTAGAGGSGGMTTGGAGGCTPVSIDHAGDTTGCSPDLQSPDCPAALVEDCANTACQNDCTDFYLCKDEAGAPTWTPVAYCDPDGNLVLSP